MRNRTFRRYTDLPAMIQALSNKELTLLDPGSWDDKNDSYFLQIYKEKTSLKSVLAMCFTSSSETYHHWSVFSAGSSGVCLHLNGSGLQSAVRRVPGVRLREIRYLKMDELRNKNPRTSQLPFIKRYPYRAEKEYRALWESKSEIKTSLNIPFDLEIISRITLSPWLHPGLRENLVAAIKRIDGCKSIPIYRSTLTDNADWKEYGSKATL